MSVAALLKSKAGARAALRPMPSGDGLIARVRPWCGAFSLEQASALADIAEQLGNGHIDLTRRANLQSGVGEECLAELHARAGSRRLLDPDPETEAARNVMVGPLAGVEVAPLWRSSSVAPWGGSTCCRPAGRSSAGGRWRRDRFSIVGERADIGLYVMDAASRCASTGAWLGGGSVEMAPERCRLLAMPGVAAERRFRAPF